MAMAESILSSDQAKIDVEIGGISDENSDAATERISEIDGVLNVHFQSKFDNTSRAQITYDSSWISLYDLFQVIQSIGYRVILKRLSGSMGSTAMNDFDDMLRQVQLHVYGMHCSSCATNISSTVHDLPGVHNVHISFDDHYANILFDARVIDTSIIAMEIEKLGFQVAVKEGTISIRSRFCYVILSQKRLVFCRIGDDIHGDSLNTLSRPGQIHSCREIYE